MRMYTYSRGSESDWHGNFGQRRELLGLVCLFLLLAWDLTVARRSFLPVSHEILRALRKCIRGADI